MGWFKEHAPNCYIKVCKWTRGKDYLSYQLYDAAERGSVDYLEALLNNGISPNFFPGKSRHSPLSIAIQNDHSDSIKKLLHYKAEVINSKFYSDDTKPFEIALKKPRFYILGLLLASNPDLGKKEDGWTNSLLGSINKSTLKEAEKTSIFTHIAQTSQLDDSIKSSFDQNTIDDLEGIIKVHKPTAQKIFVEALTRNHQSTITMMLKNHGQQLHDIDQQLDKEKRNLLFNSYNENICDFFITSQQDLLKASKKPLPSYTNLEDSYTQFLEPSYKELEKAYTEYEPAREKYKQHRMREILKNKMAALKTVKKEKDFWTWDDEQKRSQQKQKEKVLILSKDFLDNIRQWPYRKKSTLDRLTDLMIKKTKKYTYYIEQTTSCPICLEEYDSEPDSTLLKIPKSHVIMCSNSHNVCVGCFNNPMLENCPTCRETCKIEKLKTCQLCNDETDENCVLKPFYCADCSAISILCQSCNQLSGACCRKENINRKDDGPEIKKWSTIFINHVREKEKNQIIKLNTDFINSFFSTAYKLKKTQQNIAEIHNELNQIKFFSRQDIPCRPYVSIGEKCYIGNEAQRVKKLFEEESLLIKACGDLINSLKNNQASYLQRFKDLSTQYQHFQVQFHALLGKKTFEEINEKKEQFAQDPQFNLAQQLVDQIQQVLLNIK